MNKKANFVVWFFVLIVIMAFSIFSLVLNNAWNRMEEPLDRALSSNVPNDTNVNVTQILSNVGDTNRNFSNMLPFLIIGLLAFIMITAGALLKHPIMIFVGVIVLAVLIFIGGTFSNVYESIAESDSFSDTNDELQIQGTFMGALPLIAFVLAIGVVAAVLYSKSGGGGSGL